MSSQSIRSLLDQYWQGDQAAVLRYLYSGADIGAVRAQFERDRNDWVTAGGSEIVVSRQVAAAAFGLELASFYLWPEDVDGLVEWGCERLRRGGAKGEHERAWFRASVAIFTRARDDGALVRRGGSEAREPAEPVATAKPRPNHVQHAVVMFPDEERFALAAAMLAAVGADTEPRRDTEWVSDDVLGRDSAEAARRLRAAKAIELFSSVAGGPELRAEAELRAGYLRLTLNQAGAALANFARAAQSTDPFVGYLARFLAGRAMERLGNATEAERLYRGALSLMPDTPSGATALASLRLAAGDVGEATTLVEAYLATAAGRVDPWHLFGYGDLRFVPDRMSALREVVRP